MFQKKYHFETQFRRLFKCHKKQADEKVKRTRRRRRASGREGREEEGE